ncbi:MAG: hypothetical protein ACNA8W_25270, partial [Bradymonadaceae bacterium]
PIRLEGLDRRDEAMDLVFRMARAMDWRGLNTVHDDDRSLVIELSPQEPVGGRSIPAPGAPMDYTTLAPARAFREPREELPPFKPALLNSDYVIEHWEPGRRIQAQRRSLAWYHGEGALLLFILSPITLPLAVIFGYQAYLDGGVVTGLLVALSLALIAPIAYLLFPRSSRVSYHGFVVDFDEATVILEGKKSTRTIAFDAIDGVILQGWTPRDNANYGLVLSLHHEGTRTAIYQTRHQGKPTDLYENGLPMAVELARALDVPWSWEEFRGLTSSARAEFT